MVVHGSVERAGESVSKVFENAVIPSKIDEIVEAAIDLGGVLSEEHGNGLEKGGLLEGR